MTDRVWVQEFVLVGNRIIALKFVESMEFHSEEDLTADILKNDRYIGIITISGNEYVVSVMEQMDQYQRDKNDVDGYQQAIYGKWKHLLTGKS